MPHPDAIRRHACRLERIRPSATGEMHPETLELAMRQIRQWQVAAIAEAFTRNEHLRVGDEQWGIPAGCEAVGVLIAALGFVPACRSPEELFSGITDQTYGGTIHEDRDEGADPRG